MESPSNIDFDDFNLSHCCGLVISEYPRDEVAYSFSEYLLVPCLGHYMYFCELHDVYFGFTGCNGNGCKSKAYSSGAEDCES